VVGATTREERRVKSGGSTRFERRTHVEDPTIEQLAQVAGRTDDFAVRRQLFGMRELISTIIPLALIALFAGRVDWAEAGATIAGSNILLVGCALVVYYATFPLRAVRWARLLREGGAAVGWRDLVRILLLGWFVNSLVPAKLGDLYRSYLVKRKFGISMSRTVGVVVAERLLDLIVVFGLLLVGGYVAFGRTVVPDLWIVYVTAGVLGLLIAGGLVAIYALGPTVARFFPREVRRIGRLFRDAMLRLMFRYFVTEKSLAWMYDYRVDWEQPVVELSGNTPARQAA